MVYIFHAHQMENREWTYSKSSVWDYSVAKGRPELRLMVKALLESRHFIITRILLYYHYFRFLINHSYFQELGTRGQAGVPQVTTEISSTGI